MVKRGASGGAGSSQNAVKRTRTTTVESLVQQKIRDNFKTLGPQETDVVKGPDGRTLRERLHHDLSMSKSSGGGGSGEQDSELQCFGRLYYDMLKKIYMKPQALHAALLPKDPSLTVAPGLLKAMLAAQKAKPDRALFLNYMASARIGMVHSPPPPPPTHKGHTYKISTMPAWGNMFRWVSAIVKLRRNFKHDHVGHELQYLHNLTML